MTGEKLLDAIGTIDDRFLEEEALPAAEGKHRLAVALLAAVLAIILTFGTVLAVSPELRGKLLEILNLTTTEDAPISGTQPEKDKGLQSMGIQTIDGEVTVHYFGTADFVRSKTHGYYVKPWTQDDTQTPPLGIYWEIGEEGLTQAQTHRVDITFDQGEHQRRVVFDWAMVGGQLEIEPWPVGMSLNPYGNSFDLEKLPGRNDAVFLGVPMSTWQDFTHLYYSLDLETLEATPLLPEGIQSGYIWDYAQFREDLRYWVLLGYPVPTGPDMSNEDRYARYGYWLYDARAGTIELLETDYLSILEWGENFLTYQKSKQNCEKKWYYRVDLLTGEKTEIPHVEQTKPNKTPAVPEGYTLELQDGCQVLTQLATGKELLLVGLPQEGLRLYASPDGKHLLVMVEEGEAITKVGLLDFEAGQLKLLQRQPSEGRFRFSGKWVNGTTPVLTFVDTAAESRDYYIYIYYFGE